ncbi:SprT-like domain-containing protein [Limibacter armeniacum]|uniref:SprT-like domain-containing protein n=1 Tax=Limibacter armeniacum TaxID=466084 RepID=UPI002FE60826
MEYEQIVNALAKYMPVEAAPLGAKWIQDYKVHFTIKPKRKTINGDYRPPYMGKGHRISVNGSLNPYSFLVTFVHEFAHLAVWEKYQNKVQPHGKEWKMAFAHLMQPFLNVGIFPDDIRQALVAYLKNPLASSCADPALYKTLKRYDKDQDQVVLLEDLPDGSYFSLEDGRIFKKNHLLRKHFKCTEKETERTFRISGLIQVKPL